MFSALYHLKILIGYRRLGHVSKKLIKKLSHNEHVHSLSMLKFEKIMKMHVKWKKSLEIRKTKNMIISSRPLELLHMDIWSY